MTRRRWLVAGRYRLHARTVGEHLRGGDGPSCVLVHGLGVSSRYFLPTLEALAATHHAAAVDLPGFGRSPAPPDILDVAGLAGALAAWLDAAGLERPLVVANSFGCQIAVELAAAGREVAGLVLVGPTVDRRARSWWGQARRWTADGPREPPSLGLVVVRDYLDCGLRRPRATFEAALAHPIERRIAAVRAPVVVVRGERDPIAPRRWCDELAAAAPDGGVVEIPGAAHTVNYSHPDALAAVIRTLTDHGSVATMAGGSDATR